MPKGLGLFDKIRNGTEVEAREAYEEMRKASMRGAFVAIMARNFSHGIGPNMASIPKKE